MHWYPHFYASLSLTLLFSFASASLQMELRQPSFEKKTLWQQSKYRGHVNLCSTLISIRFLLWMKISLWKVFCTLSKFPNTWTSSTTKVTWYNKTLAHLLNISYNTGMTMDYSSGNFTFHVLWSHYLVTE